MSEQIDSGANTVWWGMMGLGLVTAGYIADVLAVNYAWNEVVNPLGMPALGIGQTAVLMALVRHMRPTKFRSAKEAAEDKAQAAKEPWIAIRPGLVLLFGAAILATLTWAVAS